jgi:hypothetical protein
MSEVKAIPCPFQVPGPCGSRSSVAPRRMCRMKLKLMRNQKPQLLSSHHCTFYLLPTIPKPRTNHMHYSNLRKKWLAPSGSPQANPYDKHKDVIIPTWPEGPTASARRKARSPVPQHTSSTVSPGAAPLHFTAMRFHTRCCPMLSASFSCITQNTNLMLIPTNTEEAVEVPQTCKCLT